MEVEYYKKSIYIIIVVIIVFILSLFIYKKSSDKKHFIKKNLIKNHMQITSPDFQQGGLIPVEYTCDGKDINPPLVISDIPEGVKSLALIMDDPDAPMGLWVHWVVWNIPVEKNIIEKNVVNLGNEGLNSWGKRGYGGPCPPDREHRYYFRLYALDTMLDLPEDTDKDNLLRAMEGHILAEAELMGRYNRNK